MAPIARASSARARSLWTVRKMTARRDMAFLEPPDGLEATEPGHEEVNNHHVRLQPLGLSYQ